MTFLALIPIDKAAFSYQPEDLEFSRAIRRKRFCFVFVERERIDLPSTFREMLRFKFVSLAKSALFRGANEVSNRGLLRQVIASSAREQNTMVTSNHLNFLGHLVAARNRIQIILWRLLRSLTFINPK